jgi:hypothetical protein
VPQPPALFEQKEELRGLVASMCRLPDAQRQALTLRELEGCSYKEISARLGHTGSGVRQLIFRARSTLRKGAAALLLPFGFVRDRVAAMGPVVDTHQVAGTVAVPASSGGGLDTVGAAALAVVAVLGGVAGGVRGGGHDHGRAAERSQASLGTTAPVGGSPFAVAPVAQPDSRTPRRHPGVPRGAHAAPPAPLAQAVAPVTAAPAVAAPVVPPQPAPPPAEPGAQAPPPGTPIPAAGDGQVVEHHAVSPTPAGGATPGRPVPDRVPSVPPPSGSIGAAPAKPQTGPAAPRPPAKPRPPVKPRPPAAQPSVGAPKQGARPGSHAAPARPDKTSVPAKQKKNGSATVPAVAPR